MHQGQILGLEPREVADHLVLGVVRVEHRVREVPGLASEEIGRVHGRRQGFGGEPGSRSAVERGEERVDVRHRGGLVEREAHGVGVELADVHAVCLAVRDGLVRAVRAAERDGVEKRVGGFRKANLGGALGEDGREAVGLVGDRLEPGWSVVDGVEPRHVREERLRGADVGSRLIAADVLLSGLHRHAERGRAFGVDGHADDASGHEPLVVLGGCEVPGVGPAEAHGNAEALRGSDADVGAPLAGRHEGREREEIGGGDNLGARRVSGLDDGGVVDDGAVGGGVLEEHAADVVAGVVEAVLIADDDGESESVGARLAHLDRLRVALVRDEKLGLLPAVHRAAHRHRLRGGGTLIEERRVGHGKRGEVADHGLVVEQRLQSALRDLRLVRGVLGVPSRVLEDVAQDDGGNVGAVVSGPLVGLEHLVLGRHRLEIVEKLGFGERLGPLAHVHGGCPANVGWYGCVHERVHRVEADVLGHLSLVGFRRGVVAALEAVKNIDHRGDTSVEARGGREDRATLVKSRGRVERISDAVSCPGWVGYLSRGLRASTAMVRTAPAANPGLTTARTPTLAARWATVAKGATCGWGRGKGVLSWDGRRHRTGRNV